MALDDEEFFKKYFALRGHVRTIKTSKAVQALVASSIPISNYSPSSSDHLFGGCPPELERHYESICKSQGLD